MSLMKLLPLFALTIGLSCFTGCSRINGEVASQEVDEFALGAGRDATPKTRYSFCRLLYQQGRQQSCEPLLMGLISDHPKYSPAYVLLARMRVEQGRVDDAIEALSAAQATGANDGVVANNLGICWLLKSDYARAADYFHEAVCLMPQDARYRANLALALGLSGRDEESLALYQQVLTPEAIESNQQLIEQIARSDPAPHP